MHGELDRIIRASGLIYRWSGDTRTPEDRREMARRWDPLGPRERGSTVRKWL